jgi:hypothetical protein
MSLCSFDNEILIGSKNTSKYVYELDIYKKLGNMITEFITLNKKIERNGCSMMFCFMGKSGTGKTQFCYYVNNKKLCDRIIRINLINTKGQYQSLHDILAHSIMNLKHSNVIFIEELDRYFDDLLSNKLSISDIKKSYDKENKGDDKNLMNIVNDERKNEVVKKLQNFINTLHLLADGEILPHNNIIIINSNNLQSIYKKLEDYGIKKTVIDALKSRIQVIQFNLPNHKDICDITHDIFKRCDKDFTYEHVQEIIPKDVNICYRTLDAKIILSHSDLTRLKDLLLEKPSDIIIPDPITEEDVIEIISENTGNSNGRPDNIAPVCSSGFPIKNNVNNDCYSDDGQYYPSIISTVPQYNHNGMLIDKKVKMIKQQVQEPVRNIIYNEHNQPVEVIDMVTREIDVPVYEY